MLVQVSSSYLQSLFAQEATMFMYQIMVQGEWVEVTESTYRYFNNTTNRLRKQFIPFVWVKEVFKKIF